MRTTSEVLQSFETSVEKYVAELNTLDMEDLLQKENEEEWSIGQMYMHLIQSALFMHLRNSEHCLANNENTAHADAEKQSLAERCSRRGNFLQSVLKYQLPAIYTAAT